MCEKWVPNGIRTRSGNSTDSSANHYTIGTVTGVRNSNRINLKAKKWLISLLLLLEVASTAPMSSRLEIISFSRMTYWVIFSLLN